jgi:hypothetical protein
MSLCNLPSLSFAFSLPKPALPPLPQLPVFTLAFSLACPLD